MAYDVTIIQPFAETNGFRARFHGFTGVAEAGEVTDVEFQIPEERYINGGQLLLTGHAAGDSFCYQVVDVDNVLGYGANVVLDEFVTDWQVDPEVCNQGIYETSYPAKIYTGLYVRVRYTSTGESDVTIGLNLLLHKKT